MTVPDQFHYVDGRLFCEDVDLATVAKAVGTPFNVISQARVVEQIKNIKTAFANTDTDICFALKANAQRWLIRLMASYGFGFDTVSFGEIRRVELAGLSLRDVKTVFAGVSKTDFELDYALKHGVSVVNADSMDELYALDAVTRLAYKDGLSETTRQKVALRIMTGVSAHDDHDISTGANRKFGMTPEQAREALNLYRTGGAFRNMEIIGLHIHIGSQLEGPDALVRAIEVLVPLFREFGFLVYLDLGGGMPVAYRPTGHSQPPAEFARAIDDVLERNGLAHLHRVIEPGRFPAADSSVIITEVQAVKKGDDGSVVVTVDSGMFDNPRLALYDSAYHELLPVSWPNFSSMMKCIVAGSACESDDILGDDRMLPTSLRRGSLLAQTHTGAYVGTMQMKYCGARGIPQIIVDRRVAEVVEERETVEHQVALQQKPRLLFS
jgi:diaminopimelate decarboxylase